MNEIMRQTPVTSSASDRFAHARAVGKARMEARKASREEIAPGVFIQMDRPPGVGWRLLIPGRPVRYLATRALAIAHYEILSKEAK